MESDRFPTVPECEDNLCYYQGHPGHCDVKDCQVREQALTRGNNMVSIKEILTIIRDILKHGKRRRGKKDILRHLRGGRNTRSEAILAKCYDCSAYGQYKDCDIVTCSLWPYHKGKELPNPLSEVGGR